MDSASVGAPGASSIHFCYYCYAAENNCSHTEHPWNTEREACGGEPCRDSKLPQKARDQWRCVWFGCIFRNRAPVVLFDASCGPPHWPSQSCCIDEKGSVNHHAKLVEPTFKSDIPVASFRSEDTLMTKGQSNAMLVFSTGLGASSRPRRPSCFHLYEDAFFVTQMVL